MLYFSLKQEHEMRFITFIFFSHNLSSKILTEYIYINIIMNISNIELSYFLRENGKTVSKDKLNILFLDLL
jgi:DNA-binding CsgD family transcriptional regulator